MLVGKEQKDLAQHRWNWPEANKLKAGKENETERVSASDGISASIVLPLV